MLGTPIGIRGMFKIWDYLRQIIGKLRKSTPKKHQNVLLSPSKSAAARATNSDSRWLLQNVSKVANKHPLHFSNLKFKYSKSSIMSNHTIYVR